MNSLDRRDGESETRCVHTSSHEQSIPCQYAMLRFEIREGGAGDVLMVRGEALADL